MRRSGRLNPARTVLLVLGVCLALPLSAKTLLTVDDARATMFPQVRAWDTLTKEALAPAIRAIRRDAAVTLVAANFQVQRAQPEEGRGGWFVTDQVIGKFEKIDYAVALDEAGRVLSVRVLAYRESHGHEVAEHRWLAQFAGRDAGAVLKVGRDVDGITGATLSCVHMAEGVRRITRLVAALKAAGG